MTAIPLAVWVAAGAMLGAPLRYLVDRAVQARHDSLFPWGTLAVNLVGSCGLGLLHGAGHAVGPELSAGLGVGLLGALTTYSTFSYETVRLLEEGARLYAAANVVLSLVMGVLAVAAGHAVGVSLV